MIDINIEKKRAFVKARFFGYIGAQFHGLIVPLMIYQYTKSLALAGGVMLLEWIPKSMSYVFGGVLVNMFQKSGTHVFLEALRLMAWFILIYVLTVNGNPWLIGIAAAMYQSANALSNIIFEQLVTAYWEEKEHYSGHANMMQADQLACFFGLAVSILLVDLQWVLYAATIIQLYTLIRIQKVRTLLYKSEIEQHIVTSQMQRWFNDIKYCTHPSFITFMCSMLVINIPNAVVFSIIAFFLEKYIPHSTTTTSVLSAFLLFRIAFNIGASKIVQSIASRYNTIRLAQTGAIISIMGMLCISIDYNAITFLVGVVAISIGPLWYTPYFRAWRQQLIHTHAPAESVANMTGFMIMFEALAYIIAAIILVITPMNNICNILLGCLCINSFLFARVLKHSRHQG